VTAPRHPTKTPEQKPENCEYLESYWTDPERVIPRLESLIEATYWGGD